MKRNLYLLLGLLSLLFLMVGCGSDSDSDSSRTDPSATDYPFGLQSMTVPYGESTTHLDYTYDSEGRVTGVTASREIDYQWDGRTDIIYTVDYTIKPGITVVETPDVTQESMAPNAMPMVRAEDNLDMPMTLITTLDGIPGAVVAIDHQIHSYGGMGRAVDVPDEMILLQSFSVTYAYDGNGRLIRVVQEMEDEDAITTGRLNLTYDADGNLLLSKSVAEYNRFKDDWIDDNRIVEITYTYDADGNRISKVEDQYDSSSLRITTYTYNANGLVSGEDYKRTRRVVGTLYDHNTIAYTYNDAGQLIQEVVTEYDVDEFGVETVDDIHTVGFSYHDDGRLAEKVHEVDTDGDPATANDTYTDTYTYGAAGLTSYVYLREYANGSESIYTYTLSYNDQGQVTGMQRAYDDSNDGVDDSFYIRSYTYDDNGRLVTYDYGNYAANAGEPGDATSKNVYTFTYDDQGRLTGYVYDDLDNGTDVDERMTSTATYSADGGSATGTVSILEWDDAEGALVPVHDAQVSTFIFATTAPTEPMPMQMEQFPYSEYRTKDFEPGSVYVDLPALFGLYSNTMYLLPQDRQ